MDLTDIIKSQIAGRYVPITQMTPKQLKHLRRKVTATEGAKAHGGRKPEIGGAHAIGEGQESYRQFVHSETKKLARSQVKNPESGQYKNVADAIQQARPKRKVLVRRSSVVGDNTGAYAAEMPLGGRRGPAEILVPKEGRGTVDPTVAAHEVAHASTKGSAWRNYQVTRNPKKSMREEARADSVAIRRTGMVAPHSYDESAHGTVFGTRSAARRYNTYRDIRRKTGTWT